MFSGNTVDTTRIWGENDADVMINSLQMAYPGFPHTTVSWKPNGLVLAPADTFQYAFTAASLVHHPNNAPILLVGEKLTEALRQEMVRLLPTRNHMTPQVLLIGPVSETIEQQVRNLGLSTKRIGNQNPYETSVAVSVERLALPPMSEQGQHNLFLVSGETYLESMCVPNYAMHQGQPVLLTRRTELPPLVWQFLAEHRTMNAYIVGSEATISQEVERTVRRTLSGSVTRITGTSPYEMSVQFARFFDPYTGVGWNRNQPASGDAFSFVPASNWRLAIFSGLFSHFGKHAPLLVTEPEQLPPVVLSYLYNLNPPRSGSTQPPYMHGFIFGNYDAVSYPTQVNIEEAITVREHDEGQMK
ncbi:MAG: cell wall-binding repeat-containing protein [Clostridia bacterium]